MKFKNKHFNTPQLFIKKPLPAISLQLNHPLALNVKRLSLLHIMTI
ncbi:hypothetical protein PLIP_a2113 [Pseudoalteromonas lipolytica LMEB 39]|nr:hypothetical protein [Pseudoalteromonas lipolytica LMEB 39]